MFVIEILLCFAKLPTITGLRFNGKLFDKVVWIRLFGVYTNYVLIFVNTLIVFNQSLPWFAVG